MGKNEEDAIAEVRAARQRISEKFDHDPKKLIEHYMELQQQYKERLVGRAGKDGSGTAPCDG